MKCDVSIKSPANIIHFGETKMGDIVVYEDRCYIITTPDPKSTIIWCTDLETGEEIEVDENWLAIVPKSCKLEVVL